MRVLSHDKPPVKPERPAFHIILVPDSTCDDPDRALKRGLKCLRRRFGLHATTTEVVS